jgi:hypothetical protein
LAFPVGAGVAEVVVGTGDRVVVGVGARREYVGAALLVVESEDEGKLLPEPQALAMAPTANTSSSKQPQPAALFCFATESLL